MSIYIITSKYFEIANQHLYKIGKTNETSKELLTTYSRGLPNPRIVKFYTRDEIYDNTIVENLIKDALKPHRVKADHSDMLQEWVLLPIDKVLIEIESIIKNVNDYVSGKVWDMDKKIHNMIALEFGVDIVSGLSLGLDTRLVSMMKTKHLEKKVITKIIDKDQSEYYPQLPELDEEKYKSFFDAITMLNKNHTRYIDKITSSKFIVKHMNLLCGMFNVSVKTKIRDGYINALNTLSESSVDESTLRCLSFEFLIELCKFIGCKTYDTKNKTIDHLICMFPRTQSSVYQHVNCIDKERMNDIEYLKTLYEYDLSAVCLLNNLDTKGKWIDMYNRILKK